MPHARGRDAHPAVRLARHLCGPRWAQPFVAGVILVYFLVLASGGFRTWFSPDDVMNIRLWWKEPISKLALANLLFFLPEVRPLGSAYYQLLFRLFGFNAPLFHAVRFALLVLNLWIAYRTARRISGSPATAAVTVLLFAYHGCLMLIYMSTGTIYDTLCFLFYYLAVLAYLKIRADDRAPDWRETAGIVLLLVLALDSKEMALTLPVVLAACEVARKRRSWRVPAWTGLAAGLFILGRVAIPGPLAGHPAYTPQFGLERIGGNMAAYVNQILYTLPGGSYKIEGWFTPLSAAILVASLYGAARLARSRSLELAWWLGAAGMAPLLVSPPRAGYVLYVPMLGWALYAAIALTASARRLFPRAGPASRAALFVAAAVALACVHLACRDRVVAGGPGGWEDVKLVAERIRPFCASIPPGGRILLKGVRINQQDFEWLTQLICDDPAIQAHISAPAGDIARFHVALELTSDGVRKLAGARLGSYFRLADEGAELYVVKEIVTDRLGAYGWTYANPELRLLVPPTAPRRLTLKFFISGDVLRQVGQQTVEFTLDGRSLQRVRYTQPGFQQARIPLAANAVSPGRIAILGMHIHPPFLAPDGAKLGVVLVEAGFEP